MENERKMETASAWKLLLTMSIPVILIMIVNTLYNMADVFFIGQAGDAVQVAALSLAGPVFSVVTALNTLLGFGGCTAVSIALGKGEHAETRGYTSFVLYSSLLAGLLCSFLMLIGMDSVITLLGANEQTAGHMREYLNVLAYGAPVMILSGALGNTVRADGDSRRAFIASMTGTVVNLLLDPLFISALHQGCRGAAIATVCGNAVSCALVCLVSSKKRWVSLSVRDFTLKRSVSLHVLKLGVPMASTTLLMGFSHTFVNRLLVRYGNTAVAAGSVAGKVSMLIPMIVMGICMGIQPALSYHHGAKNSRRMKDILRAAFTASMLVASGLSAVCYFFRDQLLCAFIPEETILGLGRRMILGSLLPMPVFVVYQLCTTYLQATGQVGKATLASLLREGILLIPVLYIMEALFGLTGLIYRSAVTETLSAAITFCLAAGCFRRSEFKLPAVNSRQKLRRSSGRYVCSDEG